MKKLLLVLIFLLSILNIVHASWTMKDAEHLARKALYGATPEEVQKLYNAGSASGAVNILFPSRQGPDRIEYNKKLKGLLPKLLTRDPLPIEMRAYYLYKKFYDPYEAKSKLSSLFEDIFSVDPIKGINYTDIEETHDMLYSYTLGNYEDMIKRNLYNNDGKTRKPGDYSLGRYLDLFNQTNPKYPNENYGREILQLMLMGEYLPTESSDTNGKRNYTEQDMRASSKILFGFNADDKTHKVIYDVNANTNTKLAFLSGSLNSGDNFPFVTSGDIIDIQKLKTPINGNNGLPDNIIDYIFAKRGHAISMFLADKFYRFYVAENPTKQDLNTIANKIIEYNFDIYKSVKWLLASPLMYTDKSLNNIIYKNPLELAIGTLKKLKMEDIADKLYLESILYNLHFDPYRPGSIFGRDGYDNNSVFFTPYIAIKWTTASSKLVNSFITYKLDYLHKLLLEESIKTTSTRAKDNILHIDVSSNITGDIVFTGINLFDSSDWQISYSTGTLSGNNIIINSGAYLHIGSGSIDFNKNKFYISSGTLFAGNTTYSIYSGYSNFIINNVNINANDIINILEKKLYIGRTLGNDVKQKLIHYLTTDAKGNKIDIDFNNKDVVELKLRGLIYMMLNQPEYVLQSGYGIGHEKKLVKDKSLFPNNNKIVFIKASGGLDYLHAIIPKNEYSTYLNLRGSGAMVGTGLLSLNKDYYINSNLKSFKELYDSDNLRLINRVGTPYNSRGHDSASRKITSLHNKYLKDDGIFGYFIKDEDPGKTIVLDNGTKPFLFRDGNYLGIGRNAIYNVDFSRFGITDADKNDMIDTLKNIQETRKYSGAYNRVFELSAQISSVSKKSVENGGRAGIGGNMDSKFTFLTSLYGEGLANASWLRADGGYDTHRHEKDYLNHNFQISSNSIKKFFDKVKNKYNVTIVLYSEFGRGNRINSSDGFDHGEGDGMFIISNNKDLLNKELPEKIYGNMSFKDAVSNWLGVGIDYRAVYKSLFKGLYNKDISKALGGKYDINDYIDKTPPKIELLHIDYNSYSQYNFQAKLHFDVDDKNYLSSEGSYVKFEHWTDKTPVKEYSRYKMLQMVKSDKDYIIKVSSNPGVKNYYRITTYDNQYNKNVVEYSFIVPKNSMDVDPKGSVLLNRFHNRDVSKQIILTGSKLHGIILSGTGKMEYVGTNNSKILVNTGTYVTELDGGTGLVWDGIFVNPLDINIASFIGSKAIYNSQKLNTFNIAKIIKVGAETMGVGMKLNKKVQLEINDINTGNNYIILTSEDGKSWTKLDNPNIKKTKHSIIFDTNHFSYFAAVQADSNGNPITSIKKTIKPIVIRSSDGGGGGVILTKDNCPYGDFSKSYYDKTCGVDPYHEWDTEDITEKVDNRLSKLRGDLSNYSLEDNKYSDVVNTLLNKKDFDQASIKVFSTLVQNKYIGNYKLIYLNNSKYTRYNKAFKNLAEFILNKEYKTIGFKARFFDELDSFIIYFAIYKENPELRKGLQYVLISKAKTIGKMYKDNVVVSNKKVYKKHNNLPKNDKEIQNSIKHTNTMKGEQNNRNQSSFNPDDTKIEAKPAIREKIGNYLDGDFYKVAVHSIKLKADPYWRRTDAYLYKGDILEQLTQIHTKGFFKVKIIKSRYKKYEGTEGYIFRKYLRKIK